MESILASLLAPYQEYSTLNIFLEATAVFFGLLSVWFSKKNNIWVYPTGILSTLIFVYLLYHWGLLGDMLINAYYFSMSIYGWYYWTRKSGSADLNPISQMSQLEFRRALVLFVFALCFVFVVYTLFDKWNNVIAYIDTLTTAIFFVGMWLMARRKVENWLFWIVGDLISIPLYYIKGYALTSIQYLIFTLVAVAGYYAWKKELNERD
jgi:nicotinamide mononucleotide transporter|tara:strand:- start:1769 stop:2392 length:624 start_codon:yes stop_codon:yes gene_type:complete